MNLSLSSLPAPLAVPVVQNVVAQFLVMVGYVLQAVLTAHVLQRLMQEGALTDIRGLLLWLAVVIVCRAFLLWLSEMTAQRIALRCKIHLRQRLLEQLVHLGPGISRKHSTADLQNTVTGSVEALENYYSRYLPAVFSAMTGCALVLGVMLLTDWLSGLLLTVFVIAFPLLDWLWMRWQMPRASGVFGAMAEFAASLLDALQGLMTLKAFGVSSRWRARLAGKAAALRQASMATLKVTLMRGGVTSLVMLSGLALLLALNAWRVAEHQLAPFALLLTLFLSREAFRPLLKLENAFHTAWAAGGARAPVAALLSLSPEMTTPENPSSRPTSPSVSVENVSFRYPDGKQALTDISFEIPAGQFVALVGPSGAGKSTLAALLLRWFDPDTGCLRIGGVDIRTLTPETLRSMVSVVSQELFLFDGTIAENLRLAKPDASDDELHAAATAAQIASFILSLPSGYATPIGERGARLSGGQRQRLAIARALLKDAPILLLDEATSAIDTASEQAVRLALVQWGGQRTVIAIAHRLESIRNADQILVFEDGRLVEQGQHEPLRAAGGRYSQLLAAQGEE
ncbi:ATP-binding cassette domain-containing protein [Enterobacteriaceae bacterium Kacie_13]|nr:ATP-binding cassette domain-containing protein [Enterobacteriaceae bacterium Kacie_13]